jgi:hypothetical protein
MERSTRVLYWLLVVVAVLGGYCFLGTVWWPLYFEALTLHLWLGLALAIAVIPLTAWHVRQTASPIFISLVLPAGVMALLAIVIPGRPEFPAMGPIAWAAGLTSAQLVITAVIARILPPVSRVPPVPSISGIGLTVACCWGIHVGLLGWLLRGDERWGPMLAHSAFGVFSAVLVFPHLRRFRRVVSRRWGVPGVLVLIGLLAWGWKLNYPHDLILADFQSPLDFRNEKMFGPNRLTDDRVVATSPATAEERAAKMHPTIDPEILGNSAGCGASGCHEVLTKQWSGSAHRFSADNDLYRAVIKELVSEEGAQAAIFCANCHDPVRVFAGTVEQDYADGAPPPGDGVSCVACHAFVALPSVGNGVMTLQEPRLYPGDSEEERNRNIRLDPRAHRQDLVGNFRMAEPTLACATCHRLELGPGMGAMTDAVIQNAYDLMNIQPGMLACTDCHMPTLTFPRPFEQAQYDHFLSGMGLDLSIYARHPDADPEAIAMVRNNTAKFLAGKLDLQGLTGERRVYEIAEETIGILKGGGAVSVSIEAERKEEQSLSLKVSSSNLRAGHPFPIGPFDLNEVWQEVRIVDTSGQELFHVGGLDENLRVDPNAHQLGAEELDRDGKPIQHHRIWEIAAVVERHQIPQGGTVHHLYTVELPTNVDGPIQIEVAWNYRRVNQDFADWVYDSDGTTFPVHQVGFARTEVP